MSMLRYWLCVYVLLNCGLNVLIMIVLMIVILCVLLVCNRIVWVVI